MNLDIARERAYGGSGLVEPDGVNTAAPVWYEDIVGNVETTGAQFQSATLLEGNRSRSKRTAIGNIDGSPCGSFA